MTEEKTEEKPNKFLSRKFIVWLTATIFVILAFIFKQAEVVNNLIPWWGSISLVFIGANVAQDFAAAKKIQSECEDEVSDHSN